jgi:hypothetical protein
MRPDGRGVMSVETAARRVAYSAPICGRLGMAALLAWICALRK